MDNLEVHVLSGRPHRIWGCKELVASIVHFCDIGTKHSLGLTSWGLFAAYAFDAYTRTDLLTELASGFLSDSSDAVDGRRMRRLVAYCGRVKQLFLCEQRTIMDSGHQNDSDIVRLQRLLSLLSPAPLQALFRQLNAVQLSVRTIDFAEHAFTLPLAKARHIDFAVTIQKDSMSVHRQGAGLHALQRFLPFLSRLPRLDGFSYYGDTVSVEDAEVALAVIATTFADVRTLHIVPLSLSRASFTCIATIANLECLTLHLNTFNSANVPQRLELPNLKTLTVKAHVLLNIYRFFSSLVACKLDVLKLELWKSNARLDIDLLEATCRRLRRKHSSIRDLLFELIINDGAAHLAPPTVIELAFAPFVPLFDITNLRSFRFSGPLRVRVTDTDMQDIANNWSQLECLELGKPVRQYDPAMLTEGMLLDSNVWGSFVGLLALATQKPSLRTLKIAIGLGQMKHVDISVSTPVSPICNNVQKLCIYDCPSLKATHICRIMPKMFPKLEDFMLKPYAVPRTPSMTDSIIDALAFLSFRKPGQSITRPRNQEIYRCSSVMERRPLKSKDLQKAFDVCQKPNELKRS